MVPSGIPGWVRIVQGAAVALQLLTATPALASTAYPVDLLSCVREAGIVFAGTVSDVHPEKVSGTIVTRITFTDLAFAKGERDAEKITLSQEGGQVGDMGISVTPEMHQFLPGKRYVVLADADLGSPKNRWTPIVYYNQGVFPLEPEEPGRRLVIGGGRLPAVGYREGHLVYFTTQPNFRTAGSIDGKVAAEIVYKDPGMRFSEKQFLKLIRRLASETEHQR
jgi:hypothetical protein